MTARVRLNLSGFTAEERRARRNAQNTLSRAKPENNARIRAHMRLYNASPEAKARRALPEAKARKAAYYAAYYAKPENKARKAVQVTAWRNRPEVLAREKRNHAAYYAKPENKARHKTQSKAWKAQLGNKARMVAYATRIPIEIPNRPQPDWCECCGGFAAKTLHLDHCHDTGRFRGWCCSGCNTGHGLADDNDRMRLRIAYNDRPFQPGPIQWVYPPDQRKETP